jgi:hypothetical protein
MVVFKKYFISGTLKQMELVIGMVQEIHYQKAILPLLLYMRYGNIDFYIHMTVIVFHNKIMLEMRPLMDRLL